MTFGPEKYTPPGAKEFQAPGKNKENLIKKSMKPEQKVTRQEMRGILMNETENKTNKLYETLMEDLAEEEIAEIRKQAKKEKIIEATIAKLKEKLDSPEHYQKTKENVMKAIQEAMAQMEKDGEEITRLKAAATKVSVLKEQPVPKEYEGIILSGKEDEEETKIGYIPEIDSGNDYRKISNS